MTRHIVTADGQEIIEPMLEFWMGARTPSLLAHTLIFRSQNTRYSVLIVLLTKSNKHCCYLWQFNLN